jgi:peptidoglycan/LPS O-acetylase OafA/YrhL
MNKSTSLYLDFCRFAAALAVFLHHFFDRPFYDGDIRVFFGRQAVVVFFVISGFVIAYVTDQKEPDAANYCANRASRLYSVVVPALLLTLVFDGAVKFIAPPLYDATVHTAPVLRFIGSLMFLNQSWNLTMAAFSNGPFWSLCYEFWYYVIFGLVTFGPRRARIPLAVMAALVAGPRIILLLPVWILGVAAYHLQTPMQKIRIAPIIFIAASAAFCLIAVGQLTLVNNLVGQIRSLLVEGYLFSGSPFRIYIGGDANFPADYALGVAFSLSVVTARSVARFVPVGVNLSRIIRYCASYTFSLYMFHAPLLLFFAALTYGFAPGFARSILIGMLTLFSAWAIGSLTEQKRESYRTFFSSIFRSRTLKA